MKRHFTRMLFAASLVFAIQAQLSADILLGTFEFTDNSLAVTDADALDGITISDLNINSHTLDELFSDTEGSTTADSTLDYISLDGTETENGTGAAFTAGRYLSFTITNNSGDSIDFAEIGMDYQGAGSNGIFQQMAARVFNTNAPGSVTADTITKVGKPDGGTDDAFVSRFEALDGSSPAAGANWTGQQLSLADGDSLTLFLPFNTNSNSVTRIGRFDNLSISMSAVPEPGSVVVLGLLGASAICRRRR